MEDVKKVTQDTLKEIKAIPLPHTHTYTPTLLRALSIWVERVKSFDAVP